jgi:uncharacterized DUF497 family protein
MRHRLKEATFMMYINNQRFEWDTQKAQNNIEKHGIDFVNAALAFTDPDALIFEDYVHSAVEQRQLIVGESVERVLLVVFTRREKNSIRIISARTANRKERRQYEETKRIRFF